MRKIIGSVILIFYLAGCTERSNEIAAAYVSPQMYSAYDCSQLRMEQRRLVERAIFLGAKVDNEADLDTAIAGVGFVIFWPAFFLLDGRDEQKVRELSLIKGRVQAVKSALIEQKCF